MTRQPTPTRQDRRARRREIQHLAAERWASLPPTVQTTTQLAGRGGVACGATHGVLERCNFACTSCYLTSFANRVPPLPFEEIRAQLDVMRRKLGPGGKAQITSGEVTLFDLEELGRIVAYARAIDLDPMVMTNGERLLEEPEYLTGLVRDFGLRKVSIHVDITQRGRKGLEPGMRERDLHPIRDRFADLVRQVRRETGARLHAAHTVTVTPDNLADVGDIVAWGLENADAFRMLSFQPVAEVGRTQDQRTSQDQDALWRALCSPLGRSLDADAMHFGHPSCNTTVPYLVAKSGPTRRIVDVVRPGSASDRRTLGSALTTLAPSIDLDDGVLRTTAAAALAAVKSPSLLATGAATLARRLWSDKKTWLWLAAGAARGRTPRVHPQLLVVHRFMDKDELDTPLGRERLAACVFRVPTEEGQFVSMCEVNATGIRARLNEKALATQAPEPPAAPVGHAPLGR